MIESAIKTLIVVNALVKLEILKAIHNYIE